MPYIMTVVPKDKLGLFSDRKADETRIKDMADKMLLKLAEEKYINYDVDMLSSKHQNQRIKHTGGRQDATQEYE